MTLQNVLYMSALAYSHISVSQGRSYGYCFIANNNENGLPSGLLRLLHKAADDVRMIDGEVNSLYKAIITIYNGSIHTASETSRGSWHERIDFSGYETLNKSTRRLYGIGEQNIKEVRGWARLVCFTKQREHQDTLILKPCVMDFLQEQWTESTCL